MKAQTIYKKWLKCAILYTYREIEDREPLIVANRGPGGQLSVARPPGRVSGAPQARNKITGSSDTR